MKIKTITSNGSNSEFEIHGQKYNDQKFWQLVTWLQQQRPGSKHVVDHVSIDPPNLVAHLKYYIDTTGATAGFLDVEFNDNFTMFKILK